MSVFFDQISSEDDDNEKNLNYPNIKIHSPMAFDIHDNIQVITLNKRRKIKIVNYQEKDDKPSTKTSTSIENSGGYLLWECCFDLCKYLLTKIETDFIKKKRILELGCGFGLPGVTLLKFGSPESVHFQDYNSDVIDSVTMKNVSLNCDKSDRVKYYSGEWGCFLKEDSMKSSYDIIVASEILYDIKFYRTLLSVFDHLLHKDGSILISSKRMYFEYAGNLFHFENMINESGIFTFNRVKEIKDGCSSIRDIIEIKYK